MTTEQIIATTAETTAVAAQSTVHAIASLAGSKSGKIAAGMVVTAVAGYALYKGVKWADRKITESLLNYKRKKNAEAAVAPEAKQTFIIYWRGGKKTVCSTKYGNSINEALKEVTMVFGDTLGTIDFFSVGDEDNWEWSSKGQWVKKA